MARTHVLACCMGGNGQKDSRVFRVWGGGEVNPAWNCVLATDLCFKLWAVGGPCDTRAREMTEPSFFPVFLSQSQR